jgi:lipoyl-dependent peroxiredoxin
MSIEKILYQARAKATGGRDDGRAVSSDGALGGPGGAGTNPEQLFAAGYSACFLSAMKFVARRQHRCVPDGPVIGLPGSNAVFPSHASEVAGLIEKAAKAANLVNATCVARGAWNAICES